ncbi:MAG: hypothetical protein JNN20_15060 [Betaproteobacteria bacterium]|nr:hypothetical protein [Betaproteobacteria bacterium]
MIDYRPIENHIRHARLQRSAEIGELIADGIVAAWNVIDRAASQIAAKARNLAKPPEEYSTALPRHF